MSAEHPANHEAALAPTIELMLTVAQATAVVDEIIGLRQGTALAGGQTPHVDVLVNTLIVMIAEIQGTIRVYPGITPSAKSIRRALDIRARDERDRRDERDAPPHWPGPEEAA